MKRIFLFLLICCTTAVYAEKKKVVLEERTAVSIQILDAINIKKYTKEAIKPNCIVTADIYDKDGEVVIIKKGTPVEIQCVITRPTFYGDAAKLVIQPISTTAVNGRSVVFDETETTTFTGDGDAVFSARKGLKLSKGTSFRAYTANQIVITLDL